MDDNVRKKIKKIKYLTTVFDDNMDTELYKLISMSSITRICDSKQLCDVIGGILSLYSLMNGTVLEDESFQNSLLNEGLQLNGFKIQGKVDILNHITFVDSELNAIFLRYLNSENVNNSKSSILIRSNSRIFKERFSSLNFPVGFIIAFTGLCFCLMAKKLIRYNHFYWVRQKWESFLGIVGLNQEISVYGPSYQLMPDLNVCRNVYQFFKLHHALRRRLYLGIMKLSWESGLWGNMCRAVLKFSKGLEMNQIVLINTYILQDYQELIHIEELKPELQKLQIVFQNFRTLPEEQWPYIHIMCKLPKDTWSKENFPILNYLAVQVGKRIRKDLGNYYCKLSSEMQDVANRIMSGIINFDSTSQIDLPQSQSLSENVGASSNIEFCELLEISNILEKSLHRVSGVRSFNDDDAGLVLVPNIVSCSEIKYFRIYNDSDDNLLFKTICMVNIYRIYQEESLTEIIGGILSLFSALDAETVSSDECKISLKTHGYELSEIPVKSASDLAKLFTFENSELNDLFLKFLKLECLDSSFHSFVIKDKPPVSHIFKRLFLETIEKRDILVYIGLCLVPIYKQLDEDNYSKWLEHKLKTFSRVSMWIDGQNLKFSDLLKPSKNTCTSIYSFFHSNFDLRKILFLKSLELSQSIPDQTGSIFFVICQNAKEIEINHMYLINRAILQNRKILLKMKELKPELVRFMHALEDIRSKLPSTKNGWMYIKLLLHPNEVEFLNKNNFPLLLYVAQSLLVTEERKKYAGVGKATDYFKKVEKIAEKFSSTATFSKESKKVFQLNFPNGDLLSSLSDEQLKELTINSTLLFTCHNQGLGVIPEQKEQEIMNMSIEKVKKEYEHIGIMTWRLQFLSMLRDVEANWLNDEES